MSRPTGDQSPFITRNARWRFAALASGCFIGAPLLAIGAAGCDPGEQAAESAPPAQDVETRTSDVLGATSYEIFCKPEDVPQINLAFAYARIATNSPAFRECMNRAFTGPVSITPPGYGAINIGPHIACANDPATPSTTTIFNSLKTANPTRIVCDYADIGTSTGGFAGVGGVPSTDSVTAESIALGSELGWFQGTSGPCYENVSGLPCTADQGYAETGATIMHEILHQHGYDHFEYESPSNYLCGIPASENPYYGNSVNYEVGECIRAVLEFSIDNCPMHGSCGTGGGLKLQNSIFSSTPTCSCVSDPKPGDPPLLARQVRPAAPTSCGVLTSGQGLVGSTTHASVNSCNGQYSLWMQTDGNVVLYQNGTTAKALWATGTVGSGKTLFMQADGNLVLFNEMPAAIWASDTPGNSNARLAVQDDGNLVIYSATNQVLWALNRPQPPTGCGILRVGQGLSQGQNIESCNGQYMLTMQGDGNLVQYQWNAGAIWASGTAGKAGPLAAVVLQGDGNFVLYNYTPATPGAVWATNTSGAGNYFAVQDDGNLVLYNSSNVAIWHK
jgi:hypothetical protein